MKKVSAECAKAFTFFGSKAEGNIKDLGKAWKGMIKQNHPDLCQYTFKDVDAIKTCKEERQEKTQEIQQKYDFLTDPKNGCVSLQEIRSLDDLPEATFTFGAKTLKHGGKRVEEPVKVEVVEVKPYGFTDLVYEIFWGGVMGYDLETKDEQ